MKPRLESAPATREDRLIWLRINLPLFKAYAVRPLPWHLYQASDRRDADLMYELCELRWTGAYADVRRRQVWWGQDGFHFRCWFVEIPQRVRPSQSDGMNITYFA